MLPKYDRVGGRPATYSIFPVKVGQEARDIEEAFDLVAEFRERHFIIACAMNCSKEVFNQVIRITDIALALMATYDAACNIICIDGNVVPGDFILQSSAPQFIHICVSCILKPTEVIKQALQPLNVNLTIVINYINCIVVHTRKTCF